jgi:RNA polymerase sigma-70 factor, ECF subfamily
MPSSTLAPASAERAADDLGLVHRVVRHDRGAFETIMRRHNAKLFRVARAILRNDADAEDALQEAYLAAFRAMDRFQGTAPLSTWLTRIVINEALGRLRKRKRDDVVVGLAGDGRHIPESMEQVLNASSSESPEQMAFQAQMRRLLELKIDALPLAFRTVFIMREVEDMTVEETAECLSIPEATVRTRLHRARAQLRESLALELDAAYGGVFKFDGARCDRVVAGVLERLQPLTG